MKLGNGPAKDQARLVQKKTGSEKIAGGGVEAFCDTEDLYCSR